MFIFTITIVSYTNFLDHLPGHRGEVVKLRQSVIGHIVRLDSLERVIKETMLYTDNVALIMNGKTPIIYENLIADSITLSKSTILPSLSDSILRTQMEGEGRYNLLLASFGGEEHIMSPVDGLITRQFNIAEGCFGVELTSTGRVMATQKGIVSISQWTPQDLNTIQIIHPDNTISIFRNIENAVVKRGDSVKAGEVIGDNENTITPIVFEIWSEGKPIDPEKYITF